ncbi:MAG: ABC transporter ATP-binding protein [Nanoarchaeota archaeon]|nr:ABC transporter ATP-binding protein [Nanoarchaeota archaeon]
MEKVISIKKLSKAFGNVKAVDNLSLEVQKGELFGLLGPNGSGKTTIIKLLTGQIRPTSGSVDILGIDAVNEPIKTREIVGIIPEQETPPSFLTAEEYLYFVCKIRKIIDSDKKTDYWFDMLEFNDQRRVLCKDLSRGTRQKLMVSQAFLHEPKLAFIDEPLINLDPVMQRKVKDFLTGYVKKGNTVFFSTHVLEIAQEICTEVGILEKGRLVYTARMSELRKKKKSLESLFFKKIRE